jgi:hypothetical protein
MSPRSSEFLFKLRHSPAGIAALAGTVGLISGALFVFVAAKPNATTVTKPAVAAVEVPAVQPAVRTVEAPAAGRETTGQSAARDARPADITASIPPRQSPSPQPATTDTAAAAAGSAETDANASLNCDRQAWPYITPECQAEQDRARRKVRVITTDKLAAPVVTAIEAGRAGKTPEAKTQEVKAPDAKPADVAKAAPAPAAPQATPPSSKPVTATAAVTPTAESGTTQAAADPEPAAEPMTAKQRRALAKEERRKAQREARESRREAREERARKEAMARDDSDDDEDDVEDARPVRHAPRRGRVGERWSEREYYVPSEYNPHQSRRVIVIRRAPDRGNPYMPSVHQYSRTISQY